MADDKQTPPRAHQFTKHRTARGRAVGRVDCDGGGIEWWALKEDGSGDFMLPAALLGLFPRRPLQHHLDRALAEAEARQAFEAAVDKTMRRASADPLQKAFADGGMLMGDRGPEAVLPLEAERVTGSPPALVVLDEAGNLKATGAVEVVGVDRAAPGSDTNSLVLHVDLSEEFQAALDGAVAEAIQADQMMQADQEDMAERLAQALERIAQLDDLSDGLVNDLEVERSKRAAQARDQAAAQAAADERMAERDYWRGLSNTHRDRADGLAADLAKAVKRADAAEAEAAALSDRLAAKRDLVADLRVDLRRTIQERDDICAALSDECAARAGDNQVLDTYQRLARAGERMARFMGDIAAPGAAAFDARLALVNAAHMAVTGPDGRNRHEDALAGVLAWCFAGWSVTPSLSLADLADTAEDIVSGLEDQAPALAMQMRDAAGQEARQ